MAAFGLELEGLVVVEGPDGSGKSTVSAALALELEARTGSPWPLVLDPSDGPVGRLIRDFLRGQGSDPLQALGYLFMADRMDQHQSWHRPRVVSDRYLFSTWVYQHDFTPEPVLKACLLDSRLRAPDVVVFLDVPLEVCIERCARRKGKIPEVFEQRDRMARQHKNYRGSWQNFYARAGYHSDDLRVRVLGRESIRVEVTGSESVESLVGGICEELRGRNLLPK